MANSPDLDQLATSEANDLDLHCLQRQDISRFSRTRVNCYHSMGKFQHNACPYKIPNRKKDINPGCQPSFDKKIKALQALHHAPPLHLHEVP